MTVLSALGALAEAKENAARALGMPTHVREVPTNHVQTIFRDPKTVMAALAEAEAL